MAIERGEGGKEEKEKKEKKEKWRSVKGDEEDLVGGAIGGA